MAENLLEPEVVRAENVTMFSALTLAASLVALSTGPAMPQGPMAIADDAWGAGRFQQAAALYDSSLKAHPRSIHALQRLGLWLAWDGQLDSARAVIRKARTLSPGDRGLAISEARILSWAGRRDEAIALYDSVLVVDPRDDEARLGRAQVLAWQGRLAAADSIYGEVLSRRPHDPDALMGRAQVANFGGQNGQAEGIYQQVLEGHPQNVDALIGLARVHHQQGRDRVADRQIAQALAIAPESPELRRLAHDVHASRRPRVETALRFHHDSDHNLLWTRAVSTTWAIADGLRGFGGGTSTLASDKLRDASGAGGELGASYSRQAAQLTAAVGGRRLMPDGGLDRSVASARGVVSARLAPQVVVGTGFSRAPYDESARLIGSHLDVEAWEATLKTRGPGRATLLATLGHGWFTDHNRRRSFDVDVSRPIAERWSVGLAGRTASYERRVDGYFSPDRFSVAEAHVDAGFSRGRWTTMTHGGLGAQQIGEGAHGQVEWHADQTVRYDWSSAEQLELSIGGSNSAASSTTGAYSSFTSALAIRFGL